MAGDGELSSPAETDPAGVLRFGYTLSPSQGLDPHKTSLSQDTVWLAPIYDPLIIEMPDATLVPGLATAWEWVDDNTALQLELREGVTFQDGTAVRRRGREGQHRAGQDRGGIGRGAAARRRRVRRGHRPDDRQACTSAARRRRSRASSPTGRG